MPTATFGEKWRSAGSRAGARSTISKCNSNSMRQPDQSCSDRVECERRARGAAEHIGQPDRLAWKSMCATREGREKGEKWCRRAIWGNTLPAVKRAWKSVDKLTSAAFVGMWRERVAHFESKYMAAAAAAEPAKQ